MKNLDLLVQTSRYYGTNPAYVIAGGGNTSFKTDHELYIKASGISLATIEEDGFVKMSREKLGQIENRTYPADAVEREEAVKQDLKEAVISPDHLRPSVETSLHNLIRYKYVVHTHPTVINAMMCANNSRNEVEERFGTEALYIEYTDPGYILFKKLRTLIREYEQQFNAAPKIIFLQNHGVFVGANTANEIKVMYDSIESRIRKGKDLSQPHGKVAERQSDAAKTVEAYFKERKLYTEAFSSPLADYFSDSRERFKKISRPFTPDIIVYCKSNYLFIEKRLSGEQVGIKIREFEGNHGYYPKVMIEEQGGLILVEENEKSLCTVLEVFRDMMKISYLSEQFGGPHFMTDEQIAFIDSWEVENYRRKVAKSN